MRCLIVLLFITAAPVLAQGIDAENCHRTSAVNVTCEVINRTDAAAQTLSYRIQEREDGRTYPWTDFPGETTVRGGIEPGETVQLDFAAPVLPQRANAEMIRTTVALSDAEPRQPATLRGSMFERCWNIGALSTEARGVSVKVGLTISEHGPDVGSMKMLEFAGGSQGAARQACEATRRAVIRCLAGAAPIKTGRYSVRFDTPTGTIEILP